MRPARASHGAIAVRSRGWLTTLLALLAVVSLSFLSDWHEMHPNLSDSAVVAAPHVDHDKADHDKGANKDFDHIAAHAALHGMGLPENSPVTSVPLATSSLWLAVAARFAIDNPTSTILRPPRS